MKRIVKLLMLMLLFSGAVNAQLIQKEDGKYYDKKDNLYTGTYIEYYSSGNIRVEMNILDGVKNGKTTVYFDNKNIQEVRFFQLDKMDSCWITYNEKGIKIGEANYKAGVKNGKWYVWDDNGTKRYEMEYRDGQKIGEWSIWDASGKLVGTKKY